VESGPQNINEVLTAKNPKDFHNVSIVNMEEKQKRI
jgi:hypothetical protein